MKHIVIGTAGHVDHGKTLLIRSLTGMDTDRLKEEKERGLSIDIGFAYFNLPSGRCAEIIDVPGHERFLKNMLAGVSTIDVVLLIVAADDGVMPQTKEHLDICKLLQVKNGIVVITKIDLVDKEWLELVEENIKEITKDTFLEEVPIVKVSSKTKEGFSLLVEQIDKMIANIEPKNSMLPVRLPIDRIFTMTGFGTVITGTLVSGTLKCEEQVEIYPQKTIAKVRQIHCHGEKTQEAFAGQRVGMNLAGIKIEELSRGDWIAAPGYLTVTNTIDARLSLLKSIPKALQNRTRIKLCIGTGEYIGRVILLDKKEIGPGEEVLVQFRMENKLATLKEDRFILRLYSPLLTIGGGKILNASPPKHKRFNREVIEQLEILEKGSVEDSILQILKGASKNTLSLEEIRKSINLPLEESKAILDKLSKSLKITCISENKLYIHEDNLNKLKKGLVDYLKDFHKKFPLKMGITKEEIRSRFFKKDPIALFSKVLEAKEIEEDRGYLRIRGFEIKLNEQELIILNKIETLYKNCKLNPPNLKEISLQIKEDSEKISELILYLLTQGNLVKIAEDIIIHKATFEEAKEKIRKLLVENKQAKLSQIRDYLQSSRKFTLPLLEYLDSIKFTRRVGDERQLYN
ncbi:MAG: selenocysteine-specific translation elongation factor [bacterium]|nr:selenocysteine-specific translation elongation factor [bacterium]